MIAILCLILLIFVLSRCSCSVAALLGAACAVGGELGFLNSQSFGSAFSVSIIGFHRFTKWEFNT
jgi:hypothetical protein